jgi:PhnB protein
LLLEINVKLQPYIFFDGRCEEALEFYKSVLGAEVIQLMRFRDMPDPDQLGMIPPASGNKVMHVSLRIGDTIMLASDGRCQGKPTFQGFALSLDVATEAEAERVFHALAEGGQVQMPLARAFFAMRFGMLSDRFGVNWMVHVA